MTVRTSCITVLCVDDHPVVLDGIALKISAQPDMRVVAVARDGLEAVDQFNKYRPDVTLMDLRLPTLSGLEAIQAIRAAAPSARIIVLTTYQGDEDIFRAVEAGAANYLLKDTLTDQLVRVVRDVHAGTAMLPAHIRERLAIRLGQRALTPRELQVLQRIAFGMCNKDVAKDLVISVETVQNHVKSILAKLCVDDRTAAVTAAIRRGIIHLD